MTRGEGRPRARPCRSWRGPVAWTRSVLGLAMVLRVQARVDHDQGDEETPFDTMDQRMARWVCELTVGGMVGDGMQCHHVQMERGGGEGDAE